MTLVSVIIPTYNRADLLRGAVDSVLAQTYPNIEVIVVDNGSTDSTAEIMRSYSHDARVQYIYQEGSGNPVSPRNLGVSQCRGQWIAFLDSDDEWLPGKIQLQMGCASRDERIGLVYTDVWLTDMTGKIGGRYSDRHTMVEGLVFEDLLRDNFMITSSVVIKRDLFERFNGFDAHFEIAHDLDLYLKVAAVARVGCVRVPLVRFRIHSLSLSRLRHRMYREIVDVVEPWYKGERVSRLQHKQLTSIWAHHCFRYALELIGSGDSTHGRIWMQRSVRLRPFSPIYLAGVVGALISTKFMARALTFARSRYGSERVAGG